MFQGCLGIPGNCEEQGTCEILATWDQVTCDLN